MERVMDSSCDWRIFSLHGSPSVLACENLKQDNVSLSTMEAEYIAMSEGSRETFFLMQLLQEINRKPSSIKIICDNKAAICTVKNPSDHSRIKHIDIKYHYIRNLYEQKILTIEHISSRKNVADIFTKPISKDHFHNHRQSLQLNQM